MGVDSSVGGTESGHRRQEGGGCATISASEAKESQSIDKQVPDMTSYMGMPLSHGATAVDSVKVEVVALAIANLG